MLILLIKIHGQVQFRHA